MHVSPQQFLILAQAVKLVGIDAHPWMVRAGLPDVNAMKAAPWRSVADLDTMMRVSREATGDPGFGLVVAVSMAQSLHGVLAQLTMHAPTLRATLNDVSRYARLMQLSSELSYEVCGPRCCIRFAPLGTTPEGRRARAEQIMGGTLMLLRYYGVRDPDIQHIHFAHREPAYGARYSSVFGSSVRFARAACEISIASSLLDVEHPAHNASLYGMFKAKANVELAEIERRDATGAAVSRLLLHRGEAFPNLPQAAEQLGLSERTLRRKLANEGHSYGQLLADHRQATVERLLMQGDVPLKQIAETLGYASISSFHRAFRQKTGLTPLQWKRQQLEAMSPATI